MVTLRGWAEGEGFEPPDAFASLAFKASAIGRSANPPGPAIVPHAPRPRCNVLSFSVARGPEDSHGVVWVVGLVGRGEALEALGQ